MSDTTTPPAQPVPTAAPSLGRRLLPRPRYTTFGRVIGWCMIPGSIAMILHVWIGRAMFGAPLGWVALLFPFIPEVWLGSMLLCLPGCVVLLRGLGQRPRTAIGTLDGIAQVCTWACVFVVGLTLSDGGDIPLARPTALSTTTDLSTEAIAQLFHTSLSAAGLCVVIQLILLLRGRPRTPDPTVDPAHHHVVRS